MVNFIQIPPIIITANVIKKIAAAGSGVNDEGTPCSKVWPVKSIKPFATEDMPTPWDSSSDNLKDWVNWLMRKYEKMLYP